MIRVTRSIALDPSELHEDFLRASGPGGQHVNKVETAVQLRFDAANSPNLPDRVRARLLELAGHRATKEGVVIITARAHRTRERNRVDALDKLLALLRAAAAPPPPPRRPTKPSRAAKARRADAKTQRGTTKRLRGKPADDA